MRRLVILDTGPLVAFLSARDKYHDWTVSRWREIQPPFITCESVLAEACYLLRSHPRARASVLDLLGRGIVVVPFHLAEHASPIAQLMKKYSNINMSLADACLVRMADVVANSSVLTLDSDFRLYRRANRTVLPVIMPDFGRPGK